MSDATDSPSSRALSISIVVYFPDPAWLKTTLESLVVALATARHAGTLRGAQICLIDNQSISSPSPYRVPLETASKTFEWIEPIIIAGQGNIGYGRANNLAIARCATSDFHLVLNPDVKLEEDAITNALRYLEQHTECAMVSPVAIAPDGQPLYLVKRIPDFFTLVLRGFAPDWIKQRFRARLDAYERKEVPHDAALTDVAIASGCFMLIRRSALAQVQGFDPAFFLYFEDFDLCVRIAKFACIARVPSVRIVHAGGSAAAKHIRHVWLFARSALRFFRKHS